MLIIIWIENTNFWKRLGQVEVGDEIKIGDDDVNDEFGTDDVTK